MNPIGIQLGIQLGIHFDQDVNPPTVSYVPRQFWVLPTGHQGPVVAGHVQGAQEALPWTVSIRNQGEDRYIHGFPLMNHQCCWLNL